MQQKTTKKILDIGEVAELTGLPVSALRYYEELGLIRSMGRHGLRRLFDVKILQQLQFVALGQKAGFRLEEVGQMFGSDGRLRIDRELLMEKAKDVDRHIKQLTAVREGLKHVAHCPEPNHLECPKFQKLLHLAGQHQIKLRKKTKQKPKKTGRA